ncbi:hypothetical protein ACFPM0_15765 [Pseudonocardia sulfidoxydans]|uniref:hypothetical protein n=1 Tax=Pseudonocardia sulfidoxydans TaxID=54011 RepID=UPI003622C214
MGTALLSPRLLSTGSTTDTNFRNVELRDLVHPVTTRSPPAPTANHAERYGWPADGPLPVARRPRRDDHAATRRRHGTR